MILKKKPIQYQPSLKKSTSIHPKMTKWIKEKHPLLIHAHFGPDGVLAWPMAKKLNIPLFVTFHGYDATAKDDSLLEGAFNSRNYVKNRRKLYNENVYYIAISKFIKGKLIQNGFPSERIFVNYIGTDTKELTPASSLNKKNKILFVGRLVENKGCSYLINAVKNLKQIEDLEVEVIGDGPLKKDLFALSKTISFNIQFSGPQPHKVVLERMKEAKILCVPSVEVESGASEGLGMVFVEAAALGIPVVSFQTGGIPEIVQHGQTGYLAKPKDVNQLSTYLDLLLKDDSKWKEMSLEARVFVEKFFDLSKQTQKLENIYDVVLKNV
ncbi:glycosyltransferase [Bacillus carboniphilus]|uniref:Glycosyltransferase n=1 Tax=Bacillus carboniphilus TaxID=86663 RepID=A0ABY9JT95_9BACI|nr:glycosyltransferase [Bacillus carboniphilus]WLR41508.1 glycosyltransferase [Bacillus carboniphilus]